MDLGENVKSLWTGTACNSRAPGRIYHKPFERCTKEEFIEEIRAQIYGCGALDKMIRDANGGKSLKEFSTAEIEVWHEWEFSPEGLKHFQPKWVTTTCTQPYIPSQATPVPNLFLAGSHTATQAHVWSIEGAVESGRRAAKAIDPRVDVLDQYKPWWVRLFARIDDALYALRAPQVIDFIFLILFGWVFWFFLR